VEPCKDRALSAISVIEILCGIPESQERFVHHWLHRDFNVFTIDEHITREAVNIRRYVKTLKLPDALILATATAYGYTLLTRDAKDFAFSRHAEIISQAFDK
jgi:predicted nucleic acid-binding protein